MNADPPIVAAAGLPVGEYVLDEKIGQGAFGEVWKAHHRAWTDQFAAVKIPTDPAFLRQLQSEGFSLHRLNHPNVVRVVGFDPGGNPPYLMTELIDGPSLRQLLKQGKLPFPFATAILRQILSGLAYAHEHGAVHGDLKPENVLIDRAAVGQGFTNPASVKLTDFGVGLVAVAAALGSGGSSRLLRSDRAGAVGTLAYIAPEQREGAAPDVKCDLFACGVILFELLTGERPAGAESPSELNPRVPTTMDDLFRRAYARRDRRFNSAQEFLTALDGIAASAPAAAPPPPVRPAPAPPPPPPPPAEKVMIQLLPDDAPPTPDDTPYPTQAPLPAPAEAPQMPRTPSPKQAARALVVIDELARKPLRTAEDLRGIFRRLYLTREMDQDEVANLRLRLDTWAESIGGLAGFGEKLDLTQAIDCPFHRVSVVTHYEQADGQTTQNEGAVVLANPAASQDCNQAITAEDFSPVLHISTAAFTPVLLDYITIPVIRLAAHNLVISARTQAGARRIIGQELQISTATVLSLRYLHDGVEAGACFAGNGLTVVAQIGPVIRMRDELLKRAAGLLDSDNIGAGINELRLMFLSTGAPLPRAERMLAALRGKLAATYMSLARATNSTLGIFESLTFAHRALELLPGSEEALRHELLVRKQAFWIHAGPGLTIGLVFGLISAFTRPFFYGYVDAAFAAAAAGIFTWNSLRSRPARTDVAFCHACLLPLALAAAFATGPKDPRQITGQAVTLILAGTIFAVDWLIFRNYGYWLLRPWTRPSLGGSPLDVLNQVQNMLEPDWERLRPHYMQMEPLYKHASSQVSDSPVAALEEADPDSIPMTDFGDPDADLR